MLEIVRYSPGRESEWNGFVERAKNATFLFNRGYMDYHADRFSDHSLMFYLDGDLYALLPANAVGGVLYSHQGLTYGGLITDCRATAAATVALFDGMNAYLARHGFSRVVYKAMPWIYHRLPSDEDIYAMFRTCDARITAREISSAIMFNSRIKWARSRKYGVNRARNNGLTVIRSDDFGAFWQILEANLGGKYGVSPVHTVDEIRLLRSRFPDNILLYAAVKDGVMLGGTVLYVTPQVVHSQYISASPEGKRLGAIDAIFDVVLNNVFRDFSYYFDFGKSTENHGRLLNESLMFQKEGFGARGVCYDTYEWTL